MSLNVSTAEPIGCVPDRASGSVRARASQYRLNWNEADPGSCGLQDGQHGHTPPEVEESAAIGGNMLMVAGARAEEVAEFVVGLAEPGGGSWTFEAPHGSIAAFDAPVVLLQPVIQVATGPVPHPLAQRGADRPRIAVVAVRCDPVGCYPGHRFGGAEERLGCRHIPVFTEQHVDQGPVPVDSAIEI